MVCDNLPRVVRFNAADNVRVAGVPVRVAQPVRFDQANSEVIGHIYPPRDGQCCDNVAAHKPIQKSKLLEFVKIVQPLQIARRGISPQSKFPFDHAFKFPRGFLCHSQNLIIDLTFQLQAGTDDVCSARF